MQLHPYYFATFQTLKLSTPLLIKCVWWRQRITHHDRMQKKFTPGKNHESSERGCPGAECFFRHWVTTKHGYLDTSHFLHPRLVKPQDFPVQLHQAEVLTLKLLLPGYAFVTVSVLWHSKTDQRGERRWSKGHTYGYIWYLFRYLYYIIIHILYTVWKICR